MSHSTPAPEVSMLAVLKARYEGKEVTESRSGPGVWLGFRVESLERGRAVFTLPVRPALANPFGTMHGGAIGLLMDEIIGWAVLTLDLPVRYTTVNLHVDYLWGAALGTTVRAEATVLRSGKRIVCAECTITAAADGTLLARGTSNLTATSQPAIAGALEERAVIGE